MDEQDFRRKSDAELETLKRCLLELGDAVQRHALTSACVIL
jgi:hypothetical protein